MAAGAVVMFIYIAIVLLLFISVWKVFTKAGKPGIAAIIPIYNIIVLLQIVKKPTWWFLLLLIPFVNVIMLFIIYIQLAKVFGKGAGFGLGLIFFGVIFFPILAFGSAEYKSSDSETAVS